MDRRFVLALVLLGGVGLTSGCDGGGGVPECAETAPPADTTGLKWTGEPCTADSECAYGLCYKNSAFLGIVGQGICTKSCQCGQYSNCKIDEEHIRDAHPDIYFECNRVGSDPRTKDDTMIAYCVPTAHTGISPDDANAACAALNPALVKYARNTCTGRPSACMALTGADSATSENPDSLCNLDPTQVQ